MAVLITITFMVTDEDLRELGNSLKELVEKDPDHLIRYAAVVETVTNTCQNSYENYIAKES